jgi:hypothetical protein
MIFSVPAISSSTPVDVRSWSFERTYKFRMLPSLGMKRQSGTAQMVAPLRRSFRYGLIGSLFEDLVELYGGTANNSPSGNIDPTLEELVLASMK